MVEPAEDLAVTVVLPFVGQFHETPVTDFGADPRTGMGELLGYLFDADYTGAVD